MAFFEDLGKKITQTGQDVVQKTKDTAEVIKLNSMISEEEKIVNNLYNQVGERYYELHSQSCEQELKDMIMGIKEAKRRIEEYTEQIKKLKGIERCPNCGGEVQYGAPFCSSCGTRMTTHSNVKQCTVCGANISEESAFCTNCGAKVQQEVADNDKSIDIQPNALKVCPNCNHEVDNNSVFCMNCGTKLDN